MLLIVAPAFFIVPVYFLTVVKEIIVDKRYGPGIYNEKRFAAVAFGYDPTGALSLF